MTYSDRKTPEEWCQILGVQISDPDGWRVDGKPWSDPIDESEFHVRYAGSTISLASLLAPNPKQALFDAEVEMRRQNEKWGVQRSNSTEISEWVRQLIPTEQFVKAMVDHKSEQPEGVCWSGILFEEFVEAMRSGSRTEQRTELVQCIAVIAQWVHRMDLEDAA